MIYSIKPTDKNHWLSLRTKNINSTEVSVLFGLNPHISEFQLWHQKKNNSIVEIDENPRVTWGRRLETPIAYGVAEDEGFNIRKMDEYIYDDELRLGSSFDFEITPNGILEIKNVDSLVFRDKWLVEEDGFEAAPHIELQIQTQLAVSGKEFAVLAALVGGNKIVVGRREPDLTIISEIKNRVAKFWESIDKNIAPMPNFQSDYKFISSMLNRSTEGLVVDNYSNELYELVQNYKTVSEKEKEYSEKKDIIKAKILMIVGEAEKVKGENFSISAGMVKGGPISYVRKDYRNMKIYHKKEK